MFGLSYSEIIFVVIVAAVVWMIAKRQSGGRAKTRKPPAEPVETLARCDTCGDFVPAGGAVDCGRDGCPHRSRR